MKEWMKAVEFADSAKQRAAYKEREGQRIYEHNRKEAEREYHRQFAQAVKDLDCFMHEEMRLATELLSRLQAFRSNVHSWNEEGSRLHGISVDGKIVWQTDDVNWPDASEFFFEIVIGRVPERRIYLSTCFLASEGIGVFVERTGFLSQFGKPYRFQKLSPARIVQAFSNFDDPEKWPAKLVPYLCSELNKRAKALEILAKTLHS